MRAASTVPRLSLLATTLTLLIPGVSAGASSDATTAPCVEVPGHNDRCPAWTGAYDNPTVGGDVLGEDRATAVALSPDGSRLFVTGTSTDQETGRDIAVVSFDAATGTQRWAARYHAPGDGGEVPTDIAVSPDGALVFVTGVEDHVLAYPDHSSGTGAFVTLAFDASTGERLWAATDDGPGPDVSYAVEPAPDGSRVYVSGSNQGSSPRLVTIAYGASTGRAAWRASRPGAGGEDPEAFRTDLAVSPDGSRVYAGGSEGLTPPSAPGDFLVAAYEAADGREVWGVSHDAGGEGVVGDLSATEGAVFLAGQSEFVSVVLALRPSTGAVRWEARVRGNGFSDVEVAGGRVYATGRGYALAVGFQGEPPDVEPVLETGGAVTAAYDASKGAQLWLRRFDPPDMAFEQARALGISPDGETVYVAALASRSGISGGGSAFTMEHFLAGGFQPDTASIVTLAYAAGSGDQRWVGRFDDAPASSVAVPAGIAVGAQRIYVAGHLGRTVGSTIPQQTANLSDILALAYER